MSLSVALALMLHVGNTEDLENLVLFDCSKARNGNVICEDLMVSESVQN